MSQFKAVLLRIMPTEQFLSSSFPFPLPPTSSSCWSIGSNHFLQAGLPNTHSSPQSQCIVLWFSLYGLNTVLTAKDMSGWFNELRKQLVNLSCQRKDVENVCPPELHSSGNKLWVRIRAYGKHVRTQGSRFHLVGFKEDSEREACARWMHSDFVPLWPKTFSLLFSSSFFWCLKFSGKYVLFPRAPCSVQIGKTTMWFLETYL